MKTNLKHLKSFKIFEEFVKSGINVQNFEKELKDLLVKIGATEKLIDDESDLIIKNKLLNEITSISSDDKKNEPTPELKKLKNLLNNKDNKKFREKFIIPFKNKWFDTL